MTQDGYGHNTRKDFSTWATKAIQEYKASLAEFEKSGWSSKRPNIYRIDKMKIRILNYLLEGYNNGKDIETLRGRIGEYGNAFQPERGPIPKKSVIRVVQRMLLNKEDVETAARAEIAAAKEETKSFLRKLLDKIFKSRKGQPPKGTVVVEEGITPPKGGKFLGIIGGVVTGAALFVLDYPGIGHAARISDGIYYDLKPTLLSKYRGDVHKFASAFEFYKDDLFTNKFREKYSLLDFPEEYTALASAKEKHNLSDSELKYISRIYLGAKKSMGSLKFSVEKLIAAHKWHNSLNDKEFKQKYSFERLLIKYSRSKTNFHNAEYIQKMGIDLDGGGGDFVLREVMKRMYSNIALNEFKRPILKTKRD